MINSLAARMIAALNYHEIQAGKYDPDLEEEINRSVYWCFYLDRTLSSLLHRPPSLSEIRGSPSDLVLHSSLLHMPLIRILVDMAQVQGELCYLCRFGKESDTRKALENHTKLQERMDSIYSTLQQVSFNALMCSYKLALTLVRCRRVAALRPS